MREILGLRSVGWAYRSVQAVLGSPLFRGWRAGILNDNLHVLGGGERDTLAYALALQRLGMEVELLTACEPPPRDELARMFGDDLAGFPIRRLSADAPEKALAGLGLDVFVNHSFMSEVPNPARLGLYVLMFPLRRVDRALHEQLAYNMNTYHRVVCNSSFTRFHARRRWDYPSRRMVVLNPPTGRPPPLSACFHKEKLFVNTGRFNPGLHNKNQLLLMETFLEAKTRYPELSGWCFVLVGRVNEDPASAAYHRQCAALADAHPDVLRIESNASESRLRNLLERAFGYVHGTGAFLPPGQSPECCEHFGIAVVEAMAHGCVPLVYRRGGIVDALHPGVHGFRYRDRSELVAGWARLARLYGTPKGMWMGRRNVWAARRFSPARFARRLRDLIWDAVFEYGLYRRAPVGPETVSRADTRPAIV